MTRINTALGIQSAERNEAMKTNAQPAAQSSTLDLKNKEVHAQQLLKDLRAKKAVEEEEKERELEKDRIRTSMNFNLMFNNVECLILNEFILQAKNCRQLEKYRSKRNWKISLNNERSRKEKSKSRDKEC